MAKRRIEGQEGEKVARVYSGYLTAGRRVRVDLPGGGHITTGSRRLAEAFLAERDGEPCRVEMQRPVPARPSADMSARSTENGPLGVPREGIGTRGEALFLASVKGHDVDPEAVWWPMPPVGRGAPYRYVECTWCLMKVIERDTPDGVRYAGVALALRCRRQSAVCKDNPDSDGSTSVPMDLGAERALGMRSARGRDSDTTGGVEREGDHHGRGEGAGMRAMGLSYATLANRRRGLHLAGSDELRAHMAATRLCAACGAGVLSDERVEHEGVVFCGWCAGLVTMAAFGAASSDGQAQ